jgi:hypothetical protein
MVRPEIYENLEKLTYGELTAAIANIKKNLAQADDKALCEEMDNYYLALNQELDRRDLTKNITNAHIHRSEYT